MRFARLRDKNGNDIHLWIDENFVDQEAVKWLIGTMKFLSTSSLKGDSIGELLFSDDEYVKKEKK